MFVCHRMSFNTVLPHNTVHSFMYIVIARHCLFVSDNAASFDHRQYSRELRSIAKHVYTIVIENSMTKCIVYLHGHHHNSVYVSNLHVLLPLETDIQ